jgi:Domain of unknown function (DUF5919)
MLDEPIALKVLLRERHWTYAAFCVEYDKAAQQLDRRLARTWPSRAQFQRWLAGDLMTLPHPDSCRVLEALFPGWTVEQLFARDSHRQVSEQMSRPRAADQPLSTQGDERTERWQDVTAVYSTRSELMSNYPLHALLDSATSIRACGLSLNLICQQYGVHGLRRMIERGGSLQCLFLDPDGRAIRLREQEENHVPGTLSERTRMNIRSLQDRVRTQLSEDARSRLEIAVYDETIRFSIVLVDELVAIVQPYLPALPGTDSPTFVLRRLWPDRGLFPVFDAVASTLRTSARIV